MNKYDWFFLGGLVLWLGETAFFGWNAQAGSGVEKMLDQVSLALLIYGGIGGVASAIKTTVNVNSNPTINQ